MRLPTPVLAAVSLVLFGFSTVVRAADATPAGDAETAPAAKRGELLYLANCSMCHQVNGVGTPGTYPPLAGSDWLAANRSGAIRAVVAGLNTEITVNARKYLGQMPAIMLSDEQAADTLTYVLHAWGNRGTRVTAAEAGAVRATTGFKTFEALKAAGDFAPLPAAPAGFTISELARVPDFSTRLASDGKGKRLYVLGSGGSVWRLDVETRVFKQILWPADFVGLKPGPFQTLGLTLDAQGRMWITVNQRVEATPRGMNDGAIFRTSAKDAEGDPIAPKVWFRTSYPYGIGPYTHGISQISFGRDGLLYVSSGSRTDAGEQGTVANLSKQGEVDITAVMWRMDPKANDPKIEIIARGIRNAYSFNWDGAGNLFTVANGPDAHAPEEMDFIVPPKAGEPPRHHGFPYQFGDAPADHKWYAHTPVPPAPANTPFVPPVLNLGQAGIMYGKPTSTFNAHSSPTGLTWLGNDWPESVRNAFLVGRLGSFLAGPAEGEEHGFDILHMKMERRADGGWAARTTTFLAPLGRPIDIHLAGPGKLYVLEYTRPTTLKGGIGWLPGRILELAVKKPAR